MCFVSVVVVGPLALVSFIIIIILNHGCLLPHCILIFYLKRNVSIDSVLFIFEMLKIFFCAFFFPVVIVWPLALVGYFSFFKSCVFIASVHSDLLPKKK